MNSEARLTYRWSTPAGSDRIELVPALALALQARSVVSSDL
jgi:hypothetical protein